MTGIGPRTIGNFKIERELGKGGMGVVLLGRHASLERLAVLKRLRPELSVSDELVERFAREARSAAAVPQNGWRSTTDQWRGEHYIAQRSATGRHKAALDSGQRSLAGGGADRTRARAGLEAINARRTVHRDLNRRTCCWDATAR